MKTLVKTTLTLTVIASALTFTITHKAQADVSYGTYADAYIAIQQADVEKKKIYLDLVEAKLDAAARIMDYNVYCAKHISNCRVTDAKGIQSVENVNAILAIHKKASDDYYDTRTKLIKFKSQLTPVSF